MACSDGYDGYMRYFRVSVCTCGGFLYVYTLTYTLYMCTLIVTLAYV